MADYIPSPDANFDGWFSNFKTQFSGLAVGLGFTPADVTAMNNAYTAWQTAYTANITAQNAAKGTATTKATQRKTSETTVRNFVKRIQANPACTDTMRAQLGITIADKERTPTQPPTEAPNLLLDWSQRGRVIVHVGVTPSNESTNKFGPFAKTVLLQFRTNGGDWEFLAVASTSPFVHIVGNNTPVTVEYRATYLNSKGVQGPWSDVDSAYVGAAA